MKTAIETRDPELEALLRLRDEDIDTSDIPEVRDWSNAVVGKFYRPIKEPVTLRVDLDVLERLKADGPGYQTRINTLLREIVLNRPHPSVADDEPRSPETFVDDDFSFPSLAEHHELPLCGQIAVAIEERHSVFASLG
jgi:uncharacterized protein (DUF4415 family)